MQPRCVQTADISWRSPEASRYTATLCVPRRSTAPLPGEIASASLASPAVNQSVYCHAMFAVSFANVRVAPSVMRAGS